MENWQTFLGNDNFPLIEDTFDGMTYYKLLCKLYKYVQNKQDTLTFDSTPTAGSSNPVTSDGIYAAIQNAIDDLRSELGG